MWGKILKQKKVLVVKTSVTTTQHEAYSSWGANPSRGEGPGNTTLITPEVWGKAHPICNLGGGKVGGGMITKEIPLTTTLNTVLQEEITSPWQSQRQNEGNLTSLKVDQLLCICPGIPSQIWFLSFNSHLSLSKSVFIKTRYRAETTLNVTCPTRHSSNRWSTFKTIDRWSPSRHQGPQIPSPWHQQHQTCTRVYSTCAFCFLLPSLLSEILREDYQFNFLKVYHPYKC